ncbi:MAG TPA: EscU/YscU/HrcU family type III secretion system export apparatus switch protein [Albitalea sp.]|uniref:EscU/YscU/HrcU family type III secretion system export apparatus switch protein n=1 Tax=Piscinibacter sp. TaxID=1903157 RepID=UPI002ED38626
MEKRHAPTPKRLRDARKRGDVAFSVDVSSTVVFVAVVAGLWALGHAAFDALHALWVEATGATLIEAPDAHLAQLLAHAATVLLWGMVPVAALAAVAGMLGSFVQVGGLAVWSRITPNANHLNPVEGLKRIVSMRNLVNLAKMLAKTLLLALLLFVVIRGFLGTAVTLGHGTPAAVMAAGAHALLVTFGWAAVVYAAMAAVDYVHQQHEFTKRHRMSFDDVRRERRDAEGDPQIAGRRRAVHAEAVYLSLADRVRAASAVIHSQRVAVALQYLGDKDLPRVIARGEGEVARQIVRLAGEALVPLAEDAGLAERLYDEVPADQPIPRSLYGAVATLLRWAQGDT